MAKQTFTTGQVLTASQMTSLQQTAMLGGAASAKTASYTLVAADAGAAISMSNASATTITVNTALFAAGDTVQITNLGAGVCTITAGTATVNTSASLALAQYESGTLDFTSTSAAIFIKGAGSAAASSAALTKINATPFSAVSSVSLPANTFSATYNHYKVLFIVSTVSASGNFNARLRAAGTDDTSSVYEASNIAADYGSSGLANNSSGSTQSSWTTFSYTDSSNPTYLTAEIFNPFASVRTGFVQTSVMGTTTTFTGGGKFASTTSFDSMTFIRASGTMTGTVTVYGYEI